MANPFGLPKSILAERENRRRRRFQLGVYSTLIVAAVLVVGSLIQGCRSQRPLPVQTATNAPIRMENNIATNVSTNLPPVPEASSDQSPETNCVSPGSASLPDNMTMPPPPTAVHAVVRSSSPLREPRKTGTSFNGRAVYVVKSGDTLVRIAKIHGLTVSALKSANHLKSDRIFVGEKLKL